MKIFKKSQNGEITTLMVLLGIGIMAVGIVAGKKLVEIGTNFLPKAAVNTQIPNIQTLKPIPSPMPPSDLSLISYWKMDDTDGVSIADSIGNNNATAYNSQIVSGHKGTDKARNFDGTSSYLQVALPALLNFESNQPFTILGWFKTAGADDFIVLSKFTDDSKISGYDLVISSGQIKAVLRYNPVVDEISVQTAAVSPINDNKWHQAGYTYNGSKTADGVKLYIDGTEITQRDVKYNTLSGSIYNTNPLIFGKRLPGRQSYYYNGDIDEVRIYNRELKPNEIASLYVSDQTPTPPTRTPTPTSVNHATVGLWHMDEASGNVIDSSGNGNTGIPNGTTMVAGKLGNGRRFNGSSDYITINDSPALRVTTMTLEAWIYPTSLPVNGGYIIGKNSLCAESHVDFPWAISVGGDGALYYTRSGGNDYISDGVSTSPRVISVNRWYYIAATYDGTSNRIFINGEKVAENVNTLMTSTNTQPVVIGRQSQISGDCAAAYFTGSIDEVHISNYALSAAEILANFQVQNVTPTPTPTVTPTFTPTPPSTTSTPTPFPNTTVPVGSWAFDEESGNTVADSSGNGNNGTAIGTTIVEGKYGKARSFNGTSDYVNINTVNPFTGNFTIETWVNFNQVNKTNGRDNAILGQGEAKTSNGLHVGERRGKPYFGFFNNDLAGLTALSANTWYHLAFVYDGFSKKIYVNGTLDISNSSSAYQNQLSNTRIGVYSWNANDVMNGSIDNMQIYDYARTPEQIAEDMNTSSPQTSTTISDNFDGASLDTSKWNTWKTPAGSTTVVTNQENGVFRVIIPTGQTTYSDGVIEWKQEIQRDFEVVADLKIEQSDNKSSSDTLVAFHDMQDGWKEQFIIGLRRRRDSISLFANIKSNDIWGTEFSTVLGGNSAKVKMQRIGNIANFFYDVGSGYVLLGSMSNVFGGNGRLFLLTNTWEEFPAVTSSFDNFSALVNLTCISGDLGNLNCDQGGLINETDLSILLANWRPTGSCTIPTPTPLPILRDSDITGDCKVDESDLSKLLNNWKTQ